jgi:dTDP-glucose pyrophosphorylase
VKADTTGFYITTRRCFELIFTLTPSVREELEVMDKAQQA